MLNNQIPIFDASQNSDEETISEDKIIPYSPIQPRIADGFVENKKESKNKTSQQDHFDVGSKKYKQKYKEGIEEALKETIKEQYKNHYKFYGLLNKTSRLIHRLKNIIPVFTTEILIEPTKLTIINRPFFFSEYIQSVEIGNIQRIWIETAPFFANLTILDNSPKENIIKITWIWKKDAEKARRIINGLIEAKKEEIDLTMINHDEVVEKLELIGKLHDTKTSVSGA